MEKTFTNKIIKTDCIHVSLFNAFEALEIEAIIYSHHIHTGGYKLYVATATLGQTDGIMAANPREMAPPTTT